MKVKFANKVFEVLYTIEVAGKTMYAVEDEPNHIDWLVNVEVVDDEKKESDKIEQEPYPETLDKAIELYYYTYGNGREGFDHLSLEQFKDIVQTFVDDYGMQKPAWSEDDKWMIKTICHAFEKGSSQYIWLNSLKERGQPQPQQEWSEEDEAKLTTAQVFIRNTSLNGVDGIKEATMDWLKSLKERYAWKPNLLSDIISGCDKGEFSQFEYSLIHFAMACFDENMTPKGIHCYAQTSLNEAKKEIKLTEEDEKTIHLVCEFIKLHTTAKDFFNGIDCSALIEKLKSLRFQNTWKPNDGQMKMD